MCGIAGLLSAGARPGAELERATVAMTDAIAHRGPDGSGVWTDGVAGIALGHRRLAVLDLTPTGAQPMASASGRYVVTFNGEIYNFAGLRRRIDETGSGPVWRGHSDTEILVAAFEQWGLQATLPLLEGMFVLALWDREQRSLSLARDRFGEKPLYYGVSDNTLVFGSELRALRTRMRLGDADIDLEGLSSLLHRSYVASPHSIFRQIVKLPPATWLTLRAADVAAGVLPQPEPYWDAKAAALRARANPFRGGDVELVDELKTLLERSVSLRMVADVPVGSMLSGGIDSTCISAVAQSLSSRPLKTFTIGFESAAYDESPHAAAVAAAIGSDHTTLMMGVDELTDAVTLMPGVYDEPFADSSQVPTFLVSRALRQHVTVALSGDAGDELFGGYLRHRVGPELWRKLARFPLPLRRAAARLVSIGGGSLGPTALAALLGAKGEAAGRIYKACRLIDASSPDDLYARLTRHSEPGASVMNPALNAHLGDSRKALADGELDIARRMMLHDTIDYLPNDILTKVDRAAMAVALETRPPFLDTQMFGFAWSLPTDRLISNGAGKQPLRALAARYVPAAMIDRPKQGFAMPFAAWLRAPLRSWADDLLSPSALAASGFYDVARVERLWARHRSGAADHAAQLWPVLMFEAWRRA